jgi:hypothetical protein
MQRIYALDAMNTGHAGGFWFESAGALYCEPTVRKQLPRSLPPIATLKRLRAD